MTSKRDYYEILGVSKDADSSEIKKAYRQAALKYHPDRHQGDKESEESFKEASEAYEVLSDPQKRQLYDSYGHAGLEGAGFRGFSGVDDIFGSFGSIFEEFFGGSPFGGFNFGGGRQRRRERGGADLRYDITISFEESAKGAEREISISKQVACDSCNGSGATPGTGRERCRVCNGSGHMTHSQGFFMIQTACSKCHGTGEIIAKPCNECRGHGRVRKGKKLMVKIPKGVEDGMRLILRGEGEAGETGGQPGDLYVIISVRPHDFFKRDGTNIRSSLSISFPQAALGCKLKVPTIYGDEEIEVPAGIETGEMIKLKGHGFEDVHSKKKGDHLVVVFVKTPKKVSKRQKELLEEFVKSLNL